MDKIWIRLMKIMAPTCHQRIDRSYFIKNWQMPVCARCQGIYIGYLIGLFISSPILVVFIPLTYVDGVIQLKTSYTSTNITRLITGVISGIATIQLLKIMINIIF